MIKSDEFITNVEDGPQEFPVFLHSLQLENILSFGPETVSVPLGSLNILIGPNGSGKSNFIEAINLLRASPRSLETVVRKGGGVQDWVWKGKHEGNSRLMATVSNKSNEIPITHYFEFNLNTSNFSLRTEEIFASSMLYPDNPRINYFENRGSKLALRTNDNKYIAIRNDYNLGDSVLAQRKDPDQYPEISYLAEQYNRIRIYNEWVFGGKTIFRDPQQADMVAGTLEEDFSNLGLFLNRLSGIPKRKEVILNNLRDIYEGVVDFGFDVVGGTIQVFFIEGDFKIPAKRLSDGTLRYLCLLAILCDPTPPPLICIEEPELGLHPDIIPKIADLLVEASSRTQLIVTTHSEILIDAMSDRPEVVKVFEKHNGSTQVNSLSKEDLSVWLDKYRLGELWMQGQLGGTRW